MLILSLALAVVAGPQTPGQLTRDLVLNVCVPYAVDGAADQAVINRHGLDGLIEDGEGEFRTRNQAHLVDLTTSGSEEDDNLRRICVVQARAGGFEQARDAIARPLVAAGFSASPDQPDDWPVWVRGAVSVSVHQNPGRATIIRTSYSRQDDEGF